MAARYPNTPEGVYTVEWQINRICDQIVQCVNERRQTLLMTAHDKRQEMVDRETLLSQTRLIFRSQHGHLQQLIAGLGEVLEADIPIVPRYEAMKPVVAIGKQGKAPGELYYPNSIAIENNSNQIYVVEGGHVFQAFARISIFSEGDVYLKSFTRHDMRCPRGIAIHKDNIYVSDPGVNTVFQFKLGNDIQLVNKVGGTRGSGVGQLNSPGGLAVSNNGDVYVVDTLNNRIEILNRSLQHRRTLTRELINQPNDVNLTADIVYVLCHESPCIRVFSHSGVMLRSVISQGYQILTSVISEDDQVRRFVILPEDEFQVNSPSCFCIDSNENIIISNWGAGNIKIFSKEGIHIHTIGGEEDD